MICTIIAQNVPSLYRVAAQRASNIQILTALNPYREQIYPARWARKIHRASCRRLTNTPQLPTRCPKCYIYTSIIHVAQPWSLQRLCRAAMRRLQVLGDGNGGSVLLVSCIKVTNATWVVLAFPVLFQRHQNHAKSAYDKCLYTYNTTMRANYIMMCVHPVRCVLAFIIVIFACFFELYNKNNHNKTVTKRTIIIKTR